MEQNSNFGSNSIFIDKLPSTLHPWIRLRDTNTNAKEPQIYPSKDQWINGYTDWVC